MSVLSSLSVCVVATRVERVAAVTRPTILLAASFTEWLATKRQSGRFSIFHEFRLLTGLCKSTLEEANRQGLVENKYRTRGAAEEKRVPSRSGCVPLIPTLPLHAMDSFGILRQ